MGRKEGFCFLAKIDFTLLNTLLSLELVLVRLADKLRRLTRATEDVHGARNEEGGREANDRRQDEESQTNRGEETSQEENNTRKQVVLIDSDKIQDVDLSVGDDGIEPGVTDRDLLGLQSRVLSGGELGECIQGTLSLLREVVELVLGQQLDGGVAHHVEAAAEHLVHIAVHATDLNVSSLTPGGNLLPLGLEALFI